MTKNFGSLKFSNTLGPKLPKSRQRKIKSFMTLTTLFFRFFRLMPCLNDLNKRNLVELIYAEKPINSCMNVLIFFDHRINQNSYGKIHDKSVSLLIVLLETCSCFICPIKSVQCQHHKFQAGKTTIPRWCSVPVNSILQSLLSQ